MRAGRGMVLTPRATALRPVVRDAMAAAGRVFADEGEFSPPASGLADHQRHRLRVARLRRGVRRGRARRRPGLDLRFVPNAADDAERLRAGETDRHRHLPATCRPSCGRGPSSATGSSASCAPITPP
ncbi:MAG: hypothetical protein R3F43_11925 [bacterium]